MPLDDHEINAIYKQIGACQAWKESTDKLIISLQGDFNEIREKIDCIYKRNNNRLTLKDVGYMATIGSVFLFELVKMLQK